MKKFAFLFPGQGAQYVGMMKTIIENYPYCSRVFEEASNVVGYDVKDLCLNGNTSELNIPYKMLTAIFTSSIATYQVFQKEIGLLPFTAAGHSLGEYSALVCSEMIKMEDALKLIKLRADMANDIAKNKHGSMTILENVSIACIEELCRKYSNSDSSVSISCYNSPMQLAICGNEDSVRAVEGEINDGTAVITPIYNGLPFHCRLMQEKADEFAQALDSIKVGEPKFPVLANWNAKIYSDGKAELVNNLTKQLYMPVQWISIMDSFKKQGVEIGLEIGPKAIISNLLQSSYKDITTYAFGQQNDREKAIIEFDDMKKEYRFTKTIVTRALAIAVCTKNNNWDLEAYNEGVIKPYEEIQKMQDEIEAAYLYPTDEQSLRALNMLITVFKTKKTSLAEQKSRFIQIFNETGTQQKFSNFYREHFGEEIYGEEYETR